MPADIAYGSGGQSGYFLEVHDEEAAKAKGGSEL
eukprot:gene56074-33373_t